MLYRAKLEVEIVVFTDNGPPDEDALLDHFFDDTNRESGLEPGEMTVTPVFGVDHLPEGWDACVPYGTDDDRTCEELLS